jgi:hypothetical protein
MRRPLAALALAAALIAPSGAGAVCRQALLMALDVSSSVDPEEYRLQVEGLAGALSDPEVKALLLSGTTAPVVLAVFEWSGRMDQRLLVGWTPLDGAAALDGVVAQLLTATRQGGTRPTAIGSALAFAGRLLEAGPACWERTVDISGDGKNNDGPRPRQGRKAAIYATTTVNALVIGTDAGFEDGEPSSEIGELTSYFRSEVIHGPDAFIETALGFADFGAAMKRKLLRELAVAVALQQD